MDSHLIRVNQEKLNKYADAADKALTVIRKHLEAKQREVTECNNLIQCLDELPKKRERAIMAPIGSVGFLPATIIHTNEVLVGLGDGYFVDTTAYHATEILKRRRTVIEKDIDLLHQNESLIIHQKEFTKQLFDNQNNPREVEIREEYDEAKENELRNKRRSRVTAPRMHTKTVADVNAEALMLKRLEELELLEMKNGEIEHSSNNKEKLELPSLLNRDDEHAKCLSSVLTSKKAGESSALLRDTEIQIPGGSLQSSNAGEPHKDSSGLTILEAVASNSNEFSAENRESTPVSLQETTGGTLESEITPGEYLERIYTEGSELCEVDIHSFQPPRGINTENYQRLLKTVDSINSEESDYDRISEESEYYSDNEDMECVDEKSELDSDDIPLAEATDNNCESYFSSKRVRLVEDAVQNVDRCGPLLDKTGVDQKHAHSEAPELMRLNMVDVDSKSSLKRAVDAEHKVKKKTKKNKKNVTFAENLENATLIDEHAPPSDVHGLTASTSNMVVKQILSNSGEKSPINQQAVDGMSDERKRFVYVNNNTAFSGVVQERNLDLFATENVPKVNEKSEKPCSLFKARKMHGNL